VDALGGNVEGPGDLSDGLACLVEFADRVPFRFSRSHVDPSTRERFL
jgi:hypothetical protein